MAGYEAGAARARAGREAWSLELELEDLIYPWTVEVELLDSTKMANVSLENTISKACNKIKKKLTWSTYLLNDREYKLEQTKAKRDGIPLHHRFVSSSQLFANLAKGEPSGLINTDRYYEFFKRVHTSHLKLKSICPKYEPNMIVERV